MSKESNDQKIKSILNDIMKGTMVYPNPNMTLKQKIIEILKDGPKTIDQILEKTGETRTTIRGRLSDLRKNNTVVKLNKKKFDLTSAYRKGLS